MRVLLAEDHTEVRWALRTVIKEEPGLTVAGEVSTAGELLAQAQALQPDLILLEWELPGRRAADLLPALRALGIQARVIVLSRQPECESAALAAGADAFISKANGPELLLTALRSLAGRQRMGLPTSSNLMGERDQSRVPQEGYRPKAGSPE
jgi:DNA-binding NarL/FixJ family response regulator